MAGGRLICATKGGAFAHDARTGKLLWKAAGKFNGCAPANDVLYTIMNNAPAALNLETGKVLWAVKEEIGDTASAPTLTGDKLIVGSAEGRVCAFSAQNGSLLWSAQTGASLSSLQPYKRGGSDVNSSPAILGDRIYVGASDGEVHALALDSGKGVGSYRLGVPIAASPLIVGDTLYIGGYDGNLYAFAIGK
jgi:outer membrane protein assembly factor BamB